MAPFMDEPKVHHVRSDLTESSDEMLSFKTLEGNTRRKAINWSGYLTKESAARRPSALKAAFKHLTIPGIISLGGGLPLPVYFPIHEVSVKVPSIGSWSEKETEAEGSEIRISKYIESLGREKVDSRACNGVGYESSLSDSVSKMSCSSLLEDIPLVPLATTLQYGLGTGEPNLVAFLKDHTRMVHNPPYEDWSTTLTCGNTYSFYTCLRMLVEKGDYLIMEEFAYSSAISTCGPMGIKIVGIEMDEQGMTAIGLDQVLSAWDVKGRGARKPHVVYLVPTGQNPTGASMFAQRRRDIYKTCQKHNLIIIEDEPYYFLQMEPYTSQPTSIPEQSNADLLKSLIPSFMSLDVDGRVLRLDSLSKTIAPGLRLAWLSGPSQLIERTTRHLELTTQAPSGLSQSVAYDLLARHWTHDGFFGWLSYIRREYTRRRDTAARAMQKCIPMEVASWTVPAAGMFFWVKITAPSSYDAKNVVERKLFERCLEEKVLIIPGGFFKAEGDPEGDGIGDESGVCYFRGTFAAVDEEQLVEGIERFGRSIRMEFNLSS